uniref:Protein-serine/threonine kinase n=1 Tax=Lynceus sp. MCZ IZ 141354 TaxID=1930659 RepID=A0A9N6ZFL0_9CRUS|nr:EOG090X07QN [Lynceus sp. MCZ IZ 141354]
MPSVHLVQDWYLQSFQEVLEFEDAQPDLKVLHKFCEALTKIRNRHADVVPTMAKGVMELRESHVIDQTMEHRVHYFLDRFYMSRIGIRMIINQHTLLFGDQLNGSTRHIGCIDPNCSVVSVIKDAYENARFLCDQYYLASPELLVREQNETEANVSIQIVYVPSHLYHILFELFKNAMRAVVEHHGTAARHYPPIETLVVKGSEDVTIKVSDRGGGVRRSQMDNVFHYMYSTAPQPSRGSSDSAPLAGYGYGLPLSRLYARYLLGDLSLSSCEGYGTDAYIYLKALSEEANEVLPVFNHSSSRHYRTSVPSRDWVTFSHSSARVRHISTSSSSLGWTTQ